MHISPMAYLGNTSPIDTWLSIDQATLVLTASRSFPGLERVARMLDKDSERIALESMFLVEVGCSCQTSMFCINVQCLGSNRAS